MPYKIPAGLIHMLQDNVVYFEFDIVNIGIDAITKLT